MNTQDKKISPSNFFTMKNTHLIFDFLVALSAILSTGCSNPAPIASPTCETFDAMALAQYDGTKTVTPPPPAPAPLPPNLPYDVLVIPPGTTIFSVAGGVPVSIQSFIIPGGAGSSSYRRTRIEAAPASFGSGKVANANYACLEFDFSGKSVTNVSFGFLDMIIGGKANLSVNGAAYSGGLAAAPATLGGASVSVTSTPLPGGQTGKVTVTSTTGINNLRIGGVEFYLDSLCYK